MGRKNEKDPDRLAILSCEGALVYSFPRLKPLFCCCDQSGDRFLLKSIFYPLTRLKPVILRLMTRIGRLSGGYRR
eukprot:scaffold1064_cov85-Amphora_coffeaeformis.AAC.10